MPAGNITMKADLRRPMLLREEQQSSISLLQEIDTPDVPPDTAAGTLPSQPFNVPADCYDRDAKITIPSHCTARYMYCGKDIFLHGKV